MTYTVKVWYAATPEDGEPQARGGLTSFEAEQGTMAFLRDLIELEGRGVRRLTIEAEL